MHYTSLLCYYTMLFNYHGHQILGPHNTIIQYEYTYDNTIRMYNTNIIQHSSEDDDDTIVQLSLSILLLLLLIIIIIIKIRQLKITTMNNHTTTTTTNNNNNNDNKDDNHNGNTYVGLGDCRLGQGQDAPGEGRREYKCMYAYICIYIYMYIYIYMFMYVCIYVYVHVYVCISLYGQGQDAPGGGPREGCGRPRSISEISSCFLLAETLAH